MNRLNAIIGLSWLDFLQRIRSRSFLLTICIFTIISIGFIPRSQHSMFHIMSFNGYRGIYNSAWVGVLIALLTSFCFLFFGFYIIKGGITSDFRRGNKELFLTTPGAKIEYLASKILSNVYWLLSIAIFVIFTGIVMQVLQGEDLNLELFCYLEPFLWITLPVVFFVSSLALLFDTIPFLANTIGNISYFFISGAILLGGIIGIPQLDIIGISMVFAQIIPSIKLVYPDYSGGWTFIGNSVQTAELIVWKGVSWTGEMLVYRSMWLLISGGLFLLAVWTFAHFSTKETSVGSKIPWEGKDSSFASQENFIFSPIPYGLKLHRQRRNLIHLLFAEFKFSLIRMNVGYYFVVGILMLLSVLGEPQQMYESLLPLLWLMPIGIWSQQGIKMTMDESNQITHATVNADPWIFISEYLAGFLIATTFSAPLLVRLAIAGLWGNVFYIIIGSIFITSLAGFLGFWTRGTKTFEVVYLFLWYLGPYYKIGYLDFTGSASEIVMHQFLEIYLLLSLMMVLSTLVGKRRTHL